MEITVQLLISMFTFFSLVVVTFSLFKIPLLEHHRIISVITLLLGFIHFYTRFVIETELFGLIGLSFFIVLLMVLKRYPIFYSLIVCGIGFLLVAVVDTTITMTAIHFNFIDKQSLENSLVHFVALNLVATCIVLIITFILRFFKIGFSFVIRRYTGQQALKSYNFIWASIIILSIATIQISYLVIDRRSLHLAIFVIIVLSLYTTLTVAYRQNKKSLRDRFGR